MQYNSIVKYAYNVGTIDEYKKDIYLIKTRKIYYSALCRLRDIISLTTITTTMKTKSIIVKYWLYSNDPGNVAIHKRYIRDSIYYTQATYFDDVMVIILVIVFIVIILNLITHIVKLLTNLVRRRSLLFH